MSKLFFIYALVYVRFGYLKDDRHGVGLHKSVCVYVYVDDVYVDYAVYEKPI